MNWTTPADLKSQVQKLWEKGSLLASMSEGSDLFPLKLKFKVPNSGELSEKFPDVRDWIGRLTTDTKHFRIQWRSINHRILGANEVPAEIWINTLEDALDFIGKHKQAKQFSELLEQTTKQQPELIPWTFKKPLRVLDLAGDWLLLLKVITWLSQHPRPMIYLRQIDIPGVHTKLIEKHRGVLIELLDLVMHQSTIDTTATGIGSFCRRYGFRDKPSRVRFRILDPVLKLIPSGTDQDITVTAESFSGLELPVSKIFITENEINFLSFPDTADSIVIFGAGYGFDNLATASWLKEKIIFYWGDIDTHGFAILNQLRIHFPHVRSMLMDRQTLLEHRLLWGIESKPKAGNLTRLTPKEQLLYDQLRNNHWGNHVRLEQERIRFDFLLDSLQRL
ncbi:MAG: DUF2220 family protein [Desulfobacteraceae bacterium]|jgi:hypothetical protein